MWTLFQSIFHMYYTTLYYTEEVKVGMMMTNCKSLVLQNSNRKHTTYIEVFCF